MTAKTRRSLMFAVLSLVYTMVFVQGVIMTPVANDIMRDLRLTPPAMGMLGSAYMYPYAVMMVLSGALAAVVGPRLTLSLTFFVSGLGGLLFAGAHSVGWAMAGRALCGLGLAATMTAALTLFGRWYRPGDYSRLCSTFFAIGSLGIGLGAAGVARLNAEYGWRFSFRIMGVLTIFYAVLLYLAVRDWPPSDREPPPGLDKAEREGKASLRRLAAGVGRASRSREFWRMTAWFASLAGVYFAFFGLWAMPYLKDVYRYSDAEAGLLASLAALGYCLGTPAVTWFCDNVARSYRFALALSGFATLAVAALLIWKIDSMGTPLLFALFLILGAALNASSAAGYATVRNVFGAQRAGVINGAFAGSGFVVGALMQVACGWLLYQARARGWDPGQAYALAFVPFLPCGALAFAAGCTVPRDSFLPDGADRSR